MYPTHTASLVSIGQSKLKLLSGNQKLTPKPTRPPVENLVKKCSTQKAWEDGQCCARMLKSMLKCSMRHHILLTLADPGGTHLAHAPLTARTYDFSCHIFNNKYLSWKGHNLFIMHVRVFKFAITSYAYQVYEVPLSPRSGQRCQRKMLDIINLPISYSQDNPISYSQDNNHKQQRYYTCT